MTPQEQMEMEAQAEAEGRARARLRLEQEQSSTPTNENGGLYDTLFGRDEQGSKPLLDVAKDTAVNTGMAIPNLVMSGGGLKGVFQESQKSLSEGANAGLELGGAYAGGALGGSLGTAIGMPVAGGALGATIGRRLAEVPNLATKNLFGNLDLSRIDQLEDEGYNLLKTAQSENEKQVANSMIQDARQQRDSLLGKLPQNEPSLGLVEEFGTNLGGGKLIQKVGSKFIPEKNAKLVNETQDKMRGVLTESDPTVGGRVQSLIDNGTTDPLASNLTTGQKVESPILRMIEEGLEAKDPIMTDLAGNRNVAVNRFNAEGEARVQASNQAKNLNFQQIKNDIIQKNRLLDEDFQNKQNAFTQEIQNRKNLSSQEKARIESEYQTSLAEYTKQKGLYEQELSNNKSLFEQETAQSLVNPNEPTLIDLLSNNKGKNAVESGDIISGKSNEYLIEQEAQIGKQLDSFDGATRVDMTPSLNVFEQINQEKGANRPDKLAFNSQSVQDLRGFKNQAVKSFAESPTLANARDFLSRIKSKIAEYDSYGDTETSSKLVALKEAVTQDLDTATGGQLTEALNRYKDIRQTYDNGVVGKATNKEFGENTAVKSKLPFDAIDTIENIQNTLKANKNDPIVKQELAGAFYDQLDQKIRTKDGGIDAIALSRFLNDNKQTGLLKAQALLEPAQIELLKMVSEFKPQEVSLRQPSLSEPIKPTKGVSNLTFDSLQKPTRGMKESVPQRPTPDEFSEYKPFNVKQPINFNQFRLLLDKNFNDASLTDAVLDKTGGVSKTAFSIRALKSLLSNDVEGKVIRESLVRLAKDQNFANDFFNNPEKASAIVLKDIATNPNIIKRLGAVGMKNARSLDGDDEPYLQDKVKNGLNEYLGIPVAHSEEPSPQEQPIDFNSPDLQNVGQALGVNQPQVDYSQGIPRNSAEFTPDAMNYIIQSSAGSPKALVISELARNYGLAEKAGETGKKRKLLEDLSRVAPEYFEQGSGIDNKLSDPTSQADYMKMMYNKLLRGKLDPQIFAKQHQSFADSGDGTIIPLEKDNQSKIQIQSPNGTIDRLQNPLY